MITDAQNRLERLDAQLAELAPSWAMAPVVAAYQALRGVSFVVAVTFVSEVGDVRRFDNPRQLMAFLGLVPSERSTGDTVKRDGLTLAGNRRARRVLVEGAWSYRYPARVTEPIRVRLEGLPKAVREIAWKAQTRLCARYLRMMTAGKKKPIVIAAIAREMAAFLWAIGHQVESVNRKCSPLLHRRSGLRQASPWRGAAGLRLCPRRITRRKNRAARRRDVPRWGTPVVTMWPGISPTPDTRPG